MYRDKNNYSHVNNCVSPSVRQSLLKTLEQVKAQIEYEGFTVTGTTRSGKRVACPNMQAWEICVIIAETLLIQPDKEISVNGEQTPVYIVQEMFSLLTHAHIELVIENFNKTTDLITNKSVYIRTALYNSMKELESHYKNLVQHDLGY